MRKFKADETNLYHPVGAKYADICFFPGAQLFVLTSRVRDLIVVPEKHRKC